MKLVQYAIAAGAVVIVAACGADTSNATKPNCDVDSTYQQVQHQIFEGRGCTESA